MEIIPHTVFPTMFLLGHRIEYGIAQKVGTIIVKGTFQDLDEPSSVAKENQVPIFQKDVSFNFVRNSGFEGVDDGGHVLFWVAQGGTATRESCDSSGDISGYCVRLISDGGVDCLSQTLIFDEPVGGRTFILSFYARSQVAVTLDGFRLQVPSSGESICQMDQQLITDSFQRFISPAETWPNDESSSEIEVMLSGSGNPINPIFFDRVQVEEYTTVTRWDDDTVFAYEHDLVPFKPYSDIIVLGAAKPPVGPPSGMWYAVIDINDGRRIEKAYDATTQEFPTKTTFGWAPRGEGPRRQQAGDNLATFNPNENPLPDNFKNHFYNGYDRTISGDIPLSHLNNGAVLTISSEHRPVPPGPVSAFEVKLPANRPTTTLTLLSNTGQQEEQGIPMAIDTVIIEPDLNRYLIVWRGMWEFQEHLKECYIKLSVAGGP